MNPTPAASTDLAPEAVVNLDAETLLPIGVSKPCPSTQVAHLGIADPRGIRVPCGLLDGHSGPHVFHIEWTDPTSQPSSLKQRMDAAQPRLRRPR